MKYRHSRVTWLDRGWLPGYVGFCPSKKAWDWELKRLGLDPAPYSTSDASCHTMRNKENKLCVLITVGDHIDKKTDNFGIIGLITHECMHAWRRLREDIGESEPSMEFEAYAMQYLVQTCCLIYSDTRKKLCAK